MSTSTREAATAENLRQSRWFSDEATYGNIAKAMPAVIETNLQEWAERINATPEAKRNHLTERQEHSYLHVISAKRGIRYTTAEGARGMDFTKDTETRTYLVTTRTGAFHKAAKAAEGQLRAQGQDPADWCFHQTDRSTILVLQGE